MSNTNYPVDADEHVVITTTARHKLVQARAGDITLPAIVGMAFGDGGVDSSGNVLTPTASQTALNNQLLRKVLDAVDGHTYPDNYTCRYKCTLSEAELAGKEISEIGLYDSAGDIVAIKNFMRKGKDSGLELSFTIDDIF